jgi:ankyrin repeat protein
LLQSVIPNQEINSCEYLKHSAIYYLITGYLKDKFHLIENLLSNNINHNASTIFTSHALPTTKPITKTIIQELLSNYSVEILSLNNTSHYILAIMQKDTQPPSIFFNTISNDNYIKEQYPSSRIDDLEISKFLRTAAYNGYEDMLKYLLTCDTIKINEPSRYVITALHYATQKGHIESVKLLLAHSDIDIYKQDSTGNTALHCAAYSGNIEIAKLLLAYDNDGTLINKKDNTGHIALHWAAYRGHNAFIEYLFTRPNLHINAQTDALSTTLHIAARNGYIDTIKTLLKHPDINLNAKNYKHRTALRIAQKKWKIANPALYQEIKILLLLAGAKCH